MKSVKSYDRPLYDTEVNWISNEDKHKPDWDVLSLYAYDYVTLDGKLATRYHSSSGLGCRRPVSDPHEGMAFVSRPRTAPLGAVMPGSLFQTGVNLQSLYGFGSRRPDHSGQFQRDIQFMYGNENGIPWIEPATSVELPLYRRLMEDLHVAP